MLSIAERNTEELQDSLFHELKSIADPKALQQAILAEHIRAATYASSARGRMERSQPVHTSRLMTNLRKNLGQLRVPPAKREGTTAIQELTFEEVCRLTLDSMAALGDVVAIGGGFWISGPLRLIHSADSEMLLIIGGVPNEIVRAKLGAHPVFGGAARFLSKGEIAAQPTIHQMIQPVDSWFGHADPLLSWTRCTLDAHSALLSPPDGVSAEHLEIYAPDVFRDQKRFGRWLRAAECRSPLLGVRLCRPLSSYSFEHAKPYYLGLFDYEAGSLMLRRSVRVDHDTSLRLRFGIDQLLGTPRTAAVFVGPEICELNLPYSLPEPEGKVLSLGWRKTTANNPILLHAAVIPVLLHALRRLGIEPTLASPKIPCGDH